MSIFEYLDNLKEAAEKTEIGKGIIEAGFTLYHTGGGCTAWIKELPNEWLVMITDVSASHDIKEGETILVGLSGPEGEYELSTLTECTTLADALEASKARGLAKAFADAVNKKLPEHVAEIKRRNADPNRAGTCATHDFTDANMVMLAAWESVFDGKPANLTLGYGATDEAALERAETHIARWNTAWAIAREMFLKD